MCAMRLVAVFITALLSCYRAPQQNDSCTIQCSGTGAESCPGELVCESGFCVEPGSDQVCKPTFAQVAAGTGFACAIDTNSSLWCWGENRHHQISEADQIAYPRATRTDTEHHWEAVDAGGEHVCGIADGHLYCWGANDRGQVDDGRVGQDITRPFEITVPNGPSAWTSVSAGSKHTCAIGDRKMWCWGENGNGQVGDGTRVDATPTPVAAAVDDWIAVSTGSIHTCASSETGGVYCWGNDDNGQIGPGATAPQVTPLQVLDAGGQPIIASAIAVSEQASCAIASGQVWCWGSNSNNELGETMFGQLGTPTPTRASASTGWSAIAATQHAFCGLRNNEAVCWGTTTNGGLGNGFWTQSAADRVFAAVTGTAGANKISLGWSENYQSGSDAEDLTLGCVVVGTDVLCWGDNRYGQLAIGAATMELAPTAIAGEHRFSDLQVGLSHGCGIENGAVWCWGSTEFGATTGVLAGNPMKACVPSLDCDLAKPKQLNFFAPTATDIAVGAYHTCALHAPAITCWGDSRNGQLVGTTPPPPRERDIQGPGGAPWTGLYQTGRFGQCAIYRSGTSDLTACWGFVLQQRNGPTPISALNGALGFALGSTTAGVTFDCVLDATGTLSCLGDNSVGEYGNGTITPFATLTSLGRTYSAIATNTYSPTVCGITGGSVECWGQSDRGQASIIGTALSPAAVPGLTSCTAIAVGHEHACALCGGAISCWGDNRFGQLGLGHLDADPIPMPQRAAPPPDGDTWVQLVAGNNFTCARSEQGLSKCWGFDLHAGLGNGGRSANLPVLVGATPAQ